MIHIKPPPRLHPFRIFELLTKSLHFPTFFKKSSLNRKIEPFYKKRMIQHNSSHLTFFQIYSFFCKKGIILKKRMYNSISVDSAIFGILLVIKSVEKHRVKPLLKGAELLLFTGSLVADQKPYIIDLTKNDGRWYISVVVDDPNDSDKKLAFMLAQVKANKPRTFKVFEDCMNFAVQYCADAGISAQINVHFEDNSKWIMTKTVNQNQS